MTGNECITEPCNTENADTGNHTGFENGCGSDVAEFDLAEDRDESTDSKHQAHDGCVTCNDNRFDQADSRRNSGCVADDCDNANEEDPNGKLGRGSDFDFLHADRRLNETFFKTFLINLRGAEVHLAEHRHDESGDHAAEESGNKPNSDQSRIAPAERFENAGHVNNGSGNRRSSNSDLRRDHSDRERNARADVLAFSNFNDNRDHRESGVTCTSENRQNIGNQRSQIVDVFRILVENLFSDVNEVVQAACELHGGNGRDHGCNDQDHVPRNVTRLHA